MNYRITRTHLHTLREKPSMIPATLSLNAPPHSFLRRVRQWLGAGLALGFLAVAPVRSATYVWDGGGNGSKVGDFRAKQNWGNSHDAPGGIVDDLVFTAIVGSSTTPTLSTHAATHSIVFDARAAAFTIGGAFTLTVGGGGIVNNGTTGQVFRVQRLTLGVAESWVAAAGNLSFNGLMINNDGFNLTIDGAKDTAISAAISGSGGLIKTGAGKLTLSNGTNSYTGLTDVRSGTLVYANGNVIGLSPLQVSGGTVDIGSFSDTVSAVTLVSGNLSGSTGVLNATTFNLRSGAVSAILGGTGATLVKTTAGTVSLSGANTYTGATSIKEGTLVLTGTGSIKGSMSLSIDAGATLQTAGAFSLAGRSLQLGIAAGTSNGFLNAGGALTYGGSIRLTLAGNYGTQSWNLFDFASQSGTASSFTLAGTYNGSLINEGDLWLGLVGGRFWFFNEATGVLFVIPEPGALTMLVGGFGTLLILRRGRRRWRGGSFDRFRCDS